MIKDRSSAELFKFIQTVDTKSVPSLKSILNSYDIPKISIDELLNILKSESERVLLIDARSEKEFNEFSIPYSVNFPVLNNFERHNVGLIYKKYSQSAALWLAMQYANPKLEHLKQFLEDYNRNGKNIFVYCWRGGGRSSYLSKMLCDLGYYPVTLAGGHKSFRGLVNDFFSQKNFPYELIELSGLTGCGKTELLQSVSATIPIIDLEGAARHYSSLLGQIPYEINNYSKVSSQSAFENNIFSQIYFNSTHFTHSTHSTHSSSTQASQPTQLTQPTYVIESESKKVGNFEIPKILHEKLLGAQSIKIVSSLENRVRRIVKDYFGDDMRGIALMKIKLVEKEKFFKQQLSTKIYNNLITLLDCEKVYEFTEIMMKEYYDKKYKDKRKNPIAEISSDNNKQAAEEISEIYKKFILL